MNPRDLLSGSAVVTTATAVGIAPKNARNPVASACVMPPPWQGGSRPGLFPAGTPQSPAPVDRRVVEGYWGGRTPGTAPDGGLGEAPHPSFSSP
ncbi:hypothetical protein GCM10010259_46840 [Streptomyces daghestanicus]|uniref:Uncharacterized protein n=1 Tax=Streptomyces daghestanicus TaxID=66885 RepID=A0ABQ3PVG4_9ACTN|nr:hypothetical protein GCM10010259_46840 [Streptomyces daghestanicus]GHI29002.1 hypothetical protein Sdagh_07320 [Streptomyces daghestanicus]